MTFAETMVKVMDERGMRPVDVSERSGVPGAAHDANGLTWDVVGGGLLVRVALAA